MTHSIEHRLAALERQNHTLRRTVAALAIGAGLVAALWAMGLARHEPAPKMIEARAFNLVDDNGRTLATLSNTEKGIRLRFLDDKGKIRAMIGFDPNLGPRIGLFDDSEYVRVGLAITPEGAALQLRDAGNKERVTVAQCPDCASIGVQDEHENVRAQLGYRGRTSFGQVSDGSGGTVILQSSKHRSELTIRDENHIDRVQLDSQSDGSYIGLSDANDHRRVSIFQHNDEAAVFLHGANEKDHVAVVEQEHGSGLFVATAKHPKKIVLAGDAENASLEFYGETDQAQLAAVASPQSQRIDLCGTDGRARTSMSLRDNTAAMVTYSGDTKACAYLDASGSRGELAARDDQSKVVFVQPAPVEKAAAPPYYPKKTNDESAKAANPRPSIGDLLPKPNTDSGKLDLSPSKLGDPKP